MASQAADGILGVRSCLKPYGEKRSIFALRDMGTVNLRSLRQEATRALQLLTELLDMTQVLSEAPELERGDQEGLTMVLNFLEMLIRQVSCASYR